MGVSTGTPASVWAKLEITIALLHNRAAKKISGKMILRIVLGYYSHLIRRPKNLLR